VKRFWISLFIGLSACTPSTSSQTYIEKSQIAEIINDWGFYRDQNQWGKLKKLTTADAQVSLSWICGPHSKFVELSEGLSKKNDNLLKHKIGIPRIELAEDRALAETNVDIVVRAKTPFGLVDSTSSGRFLDLLVKIENGWKLQERIAIYEKDRLDPVGLGTIPPALFEDAKKYPKQVQFLAQALAQMDRPISTQTIYDKSAMMADAYSGAQAWLHGRSGFVIDCAKS